MFKINISDLFCGGGGASTGVIAAAAMLNLGIDNFFAVNHSPDAIHYHELNHPWVQHFEEDLFAMDPLWQLPVNHLHLMWASPSCTHHSNAAGGAPRCEQLRSQPDILLKWVDSLSGGVDNLIVENVAEFTSWGPVWKRGPLKGNPKKKEKGKFFRRWIKEWKKRGYAMEWRILNCADYGDPTRRERFFMILTKTGKAITWPEPSHSKEDHIPARDIIDWDVPSESIFTRKKPLADKTMARIIHGLEKYGSSQLQPFVSILKGCSKTRSLQEALPTLTKKPHLYLVDPVMVGVGECVVPGDHTSAGKGRVKSTNDPTPTIMTKAHICVAQAFITKFHGGESGKKRVHTIKEPLRTVDTSNRFGLVEPVLVENDHWSDGEKRVLDPNRPMNTLTKRNNPSLATAHICKLKGTGRSNDIKEPLHTITGQGTPFALCESEVVDLQDSALMIGQQSGGAARSVEDPTPTIAKSGAIGLCEAYLVKYYGTGKAKSLDDPLDTITTVDTFALVIPSISTEYGFDIRYRMFQPHELAAAHSYPPDYIWPPQKYKSIEFIGNSVPVETAKALSAHVMKTLILGT